MAPSARELNVGYDEFGDWYRSYRSDVLEPGLAAAAESLNHVMNDVLSDRDRVRIRNTSGRVKSKRRIWRKLNQPRFEGEVATVDDIPAAIYDLIGLRITCTNVRDIDMVQAALESLPVRPGKRGALWLDPASERDYVLQPKESGYRAWHVNLGLAVQNDGQWIPVTCELQVRTLLQDSWGELTHEDTYSKDGALPPLVEVLSKRMADLFAILDDIAEDLRTELDRIDEAAVAETTDAQADATAELDPLVEQAADAAAVLVERWRSLDRPTDLASLAWQLQREFGAEINDDWFGHNGFKRFLMHAVPAATFSSGRQQYLLPPDAGDDGDHGTAGDGTAGRDRQQANICSDRGTRNSTVHRPGCRAADASCRPLLSAARNRSVERSVRLLAEAWRRAGAVRPSTKTVNRMAKSARDHAEAGGTAVARRHFDYVARTVLTADEGADPMPAEQLGATFLELTLQRMMDLRIIDPTPGRAHVALTRWIEGDSSADL